MPGVVSAEEGLEHLIDASKALVSILETDRLLEALMERAIELTRADRGCLMLADPDGTLRFRVGSGFDGGDEESAVMSRSVAEEVLRTGRPILSTNALGDDQLKNRRSVLALRLVTVMCAPIVAPSSRALGVLYVDSLRARTAFSPSGLAVFQALADFAAIALQNAHLYERATTDARTGLANSGLLHGRIEAAMAQAAAGAARGTSELALILIDLDHFKRVNDTWGHNAGDAVLVQVAEILKEAAASTGVPGALAARFGGEELALLLPSPAAAKASAIADRVRRAIAERVFAVGDGQTARITASIGIGRFPAVGIEHVEELIEAADACLYSAKRAGRDRVVEAAPETALVTA